VEFSAMIWLVSVILCVFPGKYNEVLNIGDKAPIWPALPGTDGKSHALDEWSSKPYLLLVFTCTSCPCARDYEDRIKAFTSKFQSQVAVVAINVNTIPEDRLEPMKKRAGERGYNFSYLYDESQKIAKAYGATYTPEFFLLDQDRRIAYMGAMDDKDDPGKVTKHYLEDALAALQSGKRPEKAETLARGCMIRYQKKRAGSK
jgi:peroxiredoxin